MEFAIAYPAKTDAWKDLVIAEDNGFSQCWFYDSQMLYSDVYVTMALAAEHTKHIKLATGVAIPSNRIEPVTAHSIATINLLAPGRTILGVGTGFTGRNTMGLPPIPAERLRSYVEMVRKLLKGEEVLYHEGKRERWIRLLHQDKGYINIKDPDSDPYRRRRAQSSRTRRRDRRRLDDGSVRAGALQRQIESGEKGTRQVGQKREQLSHRRTHLWMRPARWREGGLSSRNRADGPLRYRLPARVVGTIRRRERTSRIAGRPVAALPRRIYRQKQDAG